MAADDTGTREWTAHELGDGDVVVCEEGNPDGWIRSDTVVFVADGRPVDRPTAPD